MKTSHDLLMKKKVLVAMSGGVDSSVAAYLLQKAGFYVAGVTMCLGVKEADSTRPRCCGREAIEDARSVCERLKINHYVLDFSQELEKKVIANFVENYQKGLTPNPCAECNRQIKFGSLLKKTLALGFDYLATGHYARITKKGPEFFLKKAADLKKDQTYFLSGVKKKDLKNILFPLARLRKEFVRQIAQKAGLSVAQKKESQDLCFVPDGDYKNFILKRISNIKPGKIIDLAGRVLGQHRGLIYYTIGQRAGLGIAVGTPLYVVSIDSRGNQVIVGRKKDLGSIGLVARKINWLVNQLPKIILAKIRYTHKEALCKIQPKNDKIKVIFYEKQLAITPGQAIVFYNDDTVLGGGVIEKVLKDV